MPRKASLFKEKKTIIHVLYRDKNLFRLFLLTVFIFLLFSILLPDKFLSSVNLQSMCYQFPEYALLSLGIMITMITGGMDLSVVNTATLSGILSSLLMIQLSQSFNGANYFLIIIIGILTSIIVSIICGIINGVLITKLGISPILATLGTMQLYNGIAVSVSGGKSIIGLPEQFQVIGGGNVLELPVPLLIFIVVVGVSFIILDKTGFGNNVYMLGSNPKASLFAGVNNKAVIMKTYVMSSILASIAGIIIVARNNSAKADYGSSYILLGVLISVLGGVSPAGGSGKISGLVFAVLSLQMVSSGLNLLGVSPYLRAFVWGLLLILTMVINFLSDSHEFKKALKGLFKVHKGDCGELKP